MDIINFPGIEHTLTTTTNPFSKLKIGKISAVCPHCNNQCLLDTKGLIFREIEFYCIECGNLLKLSNPAFSSETRKKI